jgi:hypothetical protein
MNQFKIGYIVDSISQTLINHFQSESIFNTDDIDNNQLNNTRGLLKYLSSCDIEFNFRYKEKYNQIHPIIAVLNNIISKLTNFTTFLGWIQPIVKGVEIIFDILKSSLDRLNRANPLEISNTTSESFNVLVNSNQKSSIFAENTKSMILQKLHEMDISKRKTWIMPPGDTREELIRVYPMVMDFCRDNGYNFTGREHIIAFDTKREV